MNTLLSKNVTVAHYKQMEAHQKREEISEFIRDRFTERYIEPVRVDEEKKNGFTIMAVSCLMIEALESFHKGWPSSRNKSQLAFCNFFDRNPEFKFLRGYSEEFYKHVRCGILHQAETTGGWHIRRDGEVFQKDTKTINAKRFHDHIETALHNYCKELADTPWDAEVWKLFRKKMKSICANCEA